MQTVLRIVLCVTICASYDCLASTSVLHVVSEPEGIVVSLNPTDLYGMNGGVAPFSRSYTNGTPVLLNAPSATELEGTVCNFSSWLLNGIPFTANPTVEIVLSEEIIMTARYIPTQPPSTLTVASSPGEREIAIDVTPVDVQGNTSGITPFMRTYNIGIDVALIAPTVDSEGWLFKMWVLNGLPFSTNNTAYATMLSDLHLVAVYEEPSLPPGSVGTVFIVQ